MTFASSIPGSRLLHCWAVLTVAAALPLLFLGAEVTTKGVGMVDAQGLRSPWYFLQEFVNQQGLDWRIEHGHRQMGWIVGMCTIVLTGWLWLADRRWSARLLGTAALLAVGVQGCLGIFRIELNALMGRYLALIHGCFAQLVITLLICSAFITSRSWAARPAGGSANLRSWTLATVGLVVAQLIAGALVRHLDIAMSARLHVLLAFAVVAAAVWVSKLCFEHEVAPRASKVLLGLLAVQVFLGAETWLAKFFNPTSPSSMLQPLSVHADWFRSLHYVTGSMILATTVIVAWRAQQALAWQPQLRALEKPA